MGSVGRDSAPSQLNRVRFEDEVEDEAPPDLEESQNKSSKSSLVADVQGDVAILDRTMSSKASGSRGPGEAPKAAPQSNAATPIPKPSA